MHSLMQFGAKTLLEVLGSVERCSPDPRRNTSKEFFEKFRSGDEVETSLRLVSAPSPLCLRSTEEVTKSRDKADTLSSYERSIFSEMRSIRWPSNRFSRL